MGLVSKDDGWRMPDWLWERSSRCCRLHRRIRWVVTGRGCLTGTRWTRSCWCCGRDAVERAERDRDLLVELGAPALPGVGAGRRVPRDLAAGVVRVRQGGRDRLGLAGRRWGDDQGAAWAGRRPGPIPLTRDGAHPGALLRGVRLRLGRRGARLGGAPGPRGRRVDDRRDLLPRLLRRRVPLCRISAP